MSEISLTPENVYTEKNVRTLTGLEPVRKLPTAFVPDTEAGGLTHQAKEIIDNGLDELAQMAAAMLALGMLSITLCRDTARATYQLIIRDNGRGIPIGSLVDIMTKMNTSGKYDNLVYTASAGQFGYGFKVAAGTSQKMRALTYRPDGVGSLLIEQGAHAAKPDVSAAIGETGTTVVYEPDPTIFTGIVEYAETGYQALVSLLKKYVFFTHYPIEFRLLEGGVPEEFWTTRNAKATKLIREVEASAAVIWSSALHGREDWIRHYWNVTRPFHWRFTLRKSGAVMDELQDFTIQLFYAKVEPKGATFGMVNNVPIDAPGSNHLSVLIDMLSKQLAKRISDAKIREYFLESYTMPLFYAVDVKYDGAKFSGTTKSGFISAPFREVYKAELASLFAHPETTHALNELYTLLEQDINTRYMQSLAGGGKAKANRNRLFLDLKRGDKFNDCGTKNRKEAELFLVEGKSAGGASGYEDDTTGTYQLSGKPLNVLRVSGGNEREMWRKIQTNDIYQDIFKIINFDPMKPSLDNLYFGRCLLMADGDGHGRHIAAIFLGTMEFAAPLLLRSGFFGIVAPPYYEVWTGKKKTSSTFVRDKDDLVQWKAITLYDKALDIDIVYRDKAGNTAQMRLATAQMVLLAMKIFDVGIAIENLASEFSLPGLLIEAMTNVTYYLTPQTMNTETIKESLGADRVEYTASINTLVISLGREDYIIPLFNLQERVCGQVSRILQRIHWRNWYAVVSSKHNPAARNVAMSIYQLYEMFKHMDNSLLNVKTLKGIGSMNSDDAARICMDQRNRRVFNITAPGDVDVIYRLLGNDSQERKDLDSSVPLIDPTRVVF